MTPGFVARAFFCGGGLSAGVDCPGQGKVPGADAAGVVGGQSDIDLVVDVRPFGVVIGLFGEQGDPGHEAEGGYEIGKMVLALDAAALAGPAGNAGHGRLDCGVVHGFDAFGHVKSSHALNGLAFALKTAYLTRMIPRQTPEQVVGNNGLAPSIADIELLAQLAVERLPELFRSHLATVLLRVEDFPDPAVLAAMQLESEWDLLGLYQGRHVGMKGDEPSGVMPDMIFLYRRPLLEEWCEGEDTLEALVTHVLVHEVGHHFGLSDEAMHGIEADAV